MHNVCCLQMRSDGTFSTSGGSERRDVFYLTPYQVACLLPRAGSYQIMLLLDGQPVAVTSYAAPDVYATSFMFMVYDSACYECELASATCTEKPAQDGVSQHCCVDSTCRQCISTCTLVLHAHASVQTTITLSSLGRSSSVWLAANSCTAASICAPVGAAVLHDQLTVLRQWSDETRRHVSVL